MDRFRGLLGVCLAFALAGTAAAEALPIAGTQPDRRPEGAPVVTEMKKGADWYNEALTGIEPPYPASLGFLEDEGAWFTPFNHPGMTKPYDIRHWHGGE